MCWDRLIESEEMDQRKAQGRRAPSQSPEPPVDAVEPLVNAKVPELVAVS
jgi:hypothetical protein